MAFAEDFPQSCRKCTTSPIRNEGCPANTMHGVLKPLLSPPVNEIKLSITSVNTKGVSHKISLTDLDQQTNFKFLFFHDTLHTIILPTSHCLSIEPYFSQFFPSLFFFLFSNTVFFSNSFHAYFSQSLYHFFSLDQNSPFLALSFPLFLAFIFFSLSLSLSIFLSVSHFFSHSLLSIYAILSLSLFHTQLIAFLTNFSSITPFIHHSHSVQMNTCT